MPDDFDLDIRVDLSEPQPNPARPTTVTDTSNLAADGEPTNPRE